MSLYENHLHFIINKKNTYNGLIYKDDPAIMAWELANEPRGVNNREAFLSWIDRAASYIKKQDPNHLVTTGSEGNTSDKETSGTDLIKDHSSKSIDYATIHLWVQNWEWYNPFNANKTYPIAIKKGLQYLEKHITLSKKLDKPLVLEEFGISRDLNNHSAGTPTTVRDKYYTTIFEEVYNRANNKSDFAGCNFWAWGGEGRPTKPGGFWHAKDNFIGDPPHETQGWYSVYDSDTTTISIIRNFASKMNSLSK